jgi:hypothetical protein
MKFTFVLVALAGAVAVVALGAFYMAIDAATNDNGGEDNQSIAGTLTLNDSSCSEIGGTGGYSDIALGAAVVVKNEHAETIATGRLELGTDELGSCTYPFRLADVPSSEFYSIEVSHRGALTYSHEELEGLEWQVVFSLGDD